MFPSTTGSFLPVKALAEPFELVGQLVGLRYRVTVDAPDMGWQLRVEAWEATGVDLYEWATWEGDGPVDCTEKHQTYTFQFVEFIQFQ